MSSSEMEEGTSAVGGRLLGNWVEERATTSLDNTGPPTDIHKNGHKGIITVDFSSKLNGVSTLKSAFTSPKSTRVRKKGLRAELLQKQLIKSISEQVLAELTPRPPAPELHSVSSSVHTAQGFQCVRPTPSTGRDYRTDEAITFWRENFDKIQGVTAVRNRDAPFKKNASFSTPIRERLDPNPEDCTDIEEA
ncbi:sperm associated antigen 8 [Tachysurus fulvidraco]|uniref:sperm associated antigen 8 n=1 Tax=Tachysurus fulvidraco TaxID=1234273 RepID=UPI000F4F7705|nr:sperm associated antigen 8 [Tachysurus fulvidraco]XP_026999712.1 sperm associated antigen 8 [Tachysurus fulvidraco]XP_026999721.1 sperm associated antigen 8 [Tachysurus fulvidraco]